VIDLIPTVALFLALWVAGSDVLEASSGACDPAPAPGCNVVAQTDRLDEAGNTVIEFTMVDGRIISSDHPTYQMGDKVYIADPPTPSAYLISLAYVLLIGVGLQGLTGWTPGKLVAGIRLADGARRSVGVVRAFLRWALPDGAIGVVGIIAAAVGAPWPLRLLAAFAPLGLFRFLGELAPTAANPLRDERLGLGVIASADFIGGRPERVPDHEPAGDHATVTGAEPTVTPSDAAAAAPTEPSTTDPPATVGTVTVEAAAVVPATIDLTASDPAAVEPVVGQADAVEAPATVNDTATADTAATGPAVDVASTLTADEPAATEAAVTEAAATEAAGPEEPQSETEPPEITPSVFDLGGAPADAVSPPPLAATPVGPYLGGTAAPTPLPGAVRLGPDTPAFPAPPEAVAAADEDETIPQGRPAVEPVEPGNGPATPSERIDVESPEPGTTVSAAAAVDSTEVDAANPYPPQWDSARQAYICWEPVTEQWLEWDDGAGVWGPISR